MALGICELLWLNILLEDLCIATSETMKIYYDNKATIGIAHNPVNHDKTEHVEIDKYFVKEKIESGEIYITFVTSGNQLTDISTKGLSRPMFHVFAS